MSMMRLLRTVRHLRANQIAALVSHRVRGAFEDPSRLLARTVPAYPGCRWRPAKSFLPPLQINPVESILAGNLTFLNQAIAIGWPPDWNSHAVSRLWRYNLHYFDWIWALDYPPALSAALGWIDRHPAARGASGWEPYPTSLRLMNWCSFFWHQHQNVLERDSAARDKLWQSQYGQLEWLESHLETHLSGNHVLENAAALTVAGCCFDGVDARRWYERGVNLLKEQIAEQFLADGGHYERSPMYHSRAMYVLLLLSDLGDPAVSQLVRTPLNRGIEALKCMTHPDGRIALLNDSAWGIYNCPGELSKTAGASWPPGAGAFSLPESGYYGARTEDGSYVICDAGAIGPDHQPGHAHGDTLSFELSLRGHRVIVDSGVFDYEPGEMREYCRSTRAHNTIEVDGQDQCEFWGTFRVGRRAKAQAWHTRTDDGFELRGVHDGYPNLRHERLFKWSNRATLELKDTLSHPGRRKFVSRLHLHPECKVTEQSANSVNVAFAAGCCIVKFAGPGHLSFEESLFCPEFGKKIPDKTISWSGESGGTTQLDCTISCGVC